MTFFLDTNMAVGYSIIHDKHHEHANTFINNHPDLLFWSTLVKEEYDDTFEDIIMKISYFLNTVESILEDNEKNFDYYTTFERFIIKKTKHIQLDDFKKYKIIENFWKNNNLNYVNCEELYSKFLKFNKNFNNVFYQRDKKLNQVLNLHDCGKYNYLNYLSYALKLNSWGIHSPDYKILIDAHDFGLKHENLIFVTFDDVMIDILKNHDTSFLKIKEFKSCT